MAPVGALVESGSGAGGGGLDTAAHTRETGDSQEVCPLPLRDRHPSAHLHHTVDAEVRVMSPLHLLHQDHDPNCASGGRPAFGGSESTGDIRPPPRFGRQPRCVMRVVEHDHRVVRLASSGAENAEAIVGMDASGVGCLAMRRRPSLKGRPDRCRCDLKAVVLAPHPQRPAATSLQGPRVCGASRWQSGVPEPSRQRVLAARTSPSRSCSPELPTKPGMLHPVSSAFCPLRRDV